jgi:hypothetical protein
MIKAIERSYEMYIGDTLLIAFNVVDHDTQLPVDISGASFTMTGKLKVKDDDSKAIFRKTTLAGITLPAPTLGSVLVELVPQDTATLPEKDSELFYNLKMHTTDGRVFTILGGTLVIKASATGTPL